MYDADQVLRAPLPQLIQFSVDVAEFFVDGVQLGLEVFVLLVIAVKLSLVLVPFLLVGDGRELAEEDNYSR